ncbi:hypothetical protein TIFTF001_029223 [Ficus carica]|uniref:Uncharacterized protein n=1 Tax=Ficus carica TaxID=3494 RepID=A0AA88DRE1_FICCA|nr:hypothetical protein TIFTF001_029223 [Ficus carica]
MAARHGTDTYVMLIVLAGRKLMTYVYAIECPATVWLSVGMGRRGGGRWADHPEGGSVVVGEVLLELVP